MRSPRIIVVVAAALVLAAIGCAEPVTQIIVVADSDLSFPSEYAGVKVTARGPSGTSEFAREDFMMGESPRPVAVSIYPLLDAYDPLSLQVYAEGPLMDYEARLIETSWIPGESLVLEVFLSAACRGVTCAEGQTCIDGGCASPIVDPTTLPVWDGEDPTVR